MQFSHVGSFFLIFWLEMVSFSLSMSLAHTPAVNVIKERMGDDVKYIESSIQCSTKENFSIHSKSYYSLFQGLFEGFLT